jgi:hypothetical protein
VRQNHIYKLVLDKKKSRGLMLVHTGHTYVYMNRKGAAEASTPGAVLPCPLWANDVPFGSWPDNMDDPIPKAEYFWEKLDHMIREFHD